MTDWGNVNQVFRNIADAQGIEPGSTDWNKGGNNTWASSTGGQNNYGYRHDHKITAWGLTYVKSVIANYGHRGVHYNNAPVRLNGYGSAGRPVGYVPELDGDQLDGQVAYLTSKGIVLVSGADVQHFHLGPLYAVYDSSGYEVSALGKKVPASLVASVMIRYHMKMLAGMLMKSEGKPATYLWGDRGAADIINDTVGSVKRNLVDATDAGILANYVQNVAVPHYEAIQPYADNDKGSLGVKPPVMTGLAYHQLYNGYMWVTPALYDAWVLSPEGELKNRLGAIVKRHCQYFEDLEILMPGQGVSMSVVSFPPEVMAGIDGKPVPSWQPYLTKDNCHFSDIDWSLWGMRVQHIAAKVLGSAVLKAASDKNIAKWKAKGLKVEDKVWTVGADEEYLA